MKRSTATTTPRGDRAPSRGKPPDGKEEHLGYLLKRLQHSIRQAIDERLRVAQVGLSFAHVTTLFVINHHPGISGARIAKATMVTAQTVNTILRRLESEGSLERKPHPDNRRVDCWYITEAGRAQMQKARAAADPVWDNMLAPLGEQEVSQLRGLLKRCIEGLEQNRTVIEPCSPSAVPPRSSRVARRGAGRTRKDPLAKGKRA
jgi:DNA-binding MarR family transcriptional regulator